MTYTYDRTAASWDQSILHISPDEFADMDEGERRQFVAKELNRAADLLFEIRKLSVSSDIEVTDITQAAGMIVKVARKLSRFNANRGND